MTAAEAVNALLRLLCLALLVNCLCIRGWSNQYPKKNNKRSAFLISATRGNYNYRDNNNDNEELFSGRTRRNDNADYWEKPNGASSSSSSSSNSYSFNQDDDEEDGYDNDEDAYYGYEMNAPPPPPRTQDTMEWEACSSDAGTAHVLLPPLSVERPTAVIHFVGGTFFGSAPSLWYNRFLQELVKHTQAAVVATSIPVTVFQSSPLQHVTLAKKLERQFQIAWRDVLCDEYGREAMKNVAVCGLGHSLGSRLLVVLATIGKAKSQRRRQRPDVPPPPPEWKAMVLVSFTNYGAAAGIPGIAQLNRASRKLKQESKSDRVSNRQKQKERRQRRGYYESEYWDDYEDDDEDDWGELLSDLGDLLKNQATKLQTALTPSEEDLEFYPSPDELWKALGIDKRYGINNTLLVQFDDDEVDQSAKLASALLESGMVYFSRIRGTHLTPVAPINPKRNSNSNVDASAVSSWLDRFNSRLGKGLAKILTGQRRARQNEESLLQLRQAASSFIIEKVTKDR